MPLKSLTPKMPPRESLLQDDAQTAGSQDSAGAGAPLTESGDRLRSRTATVVAQQDDSGYELLTPTSRDREQAKRKEEELHLLEEFREERPEGASEKSVLYDFFELSAATWRWLQCRFGDGYAQSGAVSDGILRSVWRKSEKSFQQLIQRLYPALAVLQWWFFNVLLVLLNKWIFQVYRFNFPLSLTCIHFAISFVGAFICIRVLKMKPLAKVTRSDLVLRVLPIAIVTNLNVCLGNVSLRFIPVTFMQTVKAFTPATTVALQAVFQGKIFHPRVFIALIPVVGGVTLASATELSFHAAGFVAALLSTIFTSANSILAEVVLKGHVDMDSINTVYYMAPQICLMLAPLAALLETKGLVEWHYEAREHTQVLGVVIVSGVLAFGLNFSLFYAIQATSAMTFNVAGNLKVAVAMLLGWLIFRNPMSMYSVLGCAVTVGGCMWYGYVQQKVRFEEMQRHHLVSTPTLYSEKHSASEESSGQQLLVIQAGQADASNGTEQTKLVK